MWQRTLEKIHHSYGTTEKANYEIQKAFDTYREKDLAEFLDWVYSNSMLDELIESVEIAERYIKRK